MQQRIPSKYYQISVYSKYIGEQKGKCWITILNGFIIMNNNIGILQISWQIHFFFNLI